MIETGTKNFLKIFFLFASFSGISFITNCDLFAKKSFWIKNESRTQKSRSPFFQTLALAQVLQLFHKHDSIFLDARAKQYFDYGHIQGAVSLPMDQIFSASSEQINEWKKAPSVIVYCNGASCSSAYQAARLLMEKGLANVGVYPEGWPEWRSCHLPMTMSPQMKADLLSEQNH